MRSRRPWPNPTKRACKPSTSRYTTCTWTARFRWTKRCATRTREPILRCAYASRWASAPPMRRTWASTAERPRLESKASRIKMPQRLQHMQCNRLAQTFILPRGANSASVWRFTSEHCRNILSSSDCSDRETLVPDVKGEKMPPGEPAGVYSPWVSRALRHAMAAGRRFCHALVLDMSERRRLEATLFTSRERLRALLDNIPDIAWLKDTEGRYTAVNKAFASAVGKRVEDFAGKKLQDIWPQAVEKRTFYKDDQGVIQSRAPVRTEISVMTSQGERWLTVTRVPVFGAAGEVTGVAGIARDITDEKAATRKIQYMNSVLRAQQQTSPDGILLVDEGGRIVSYNRQFMALFGIDDQLVKAGKDKLLLQSVMGKIAAPEAFLARVRYLYEHREEKSHEEILLTDGRTLERHSAPVTGEGKYYGRVWYFRDITERKRSEETSRQLAAIVQSSRVAIVGRDLQGRITSWNPGAEALYGYSAAEMIGRSVLTLTPDAEKSRVL